MAGPRKAKHDVSPVVRSGFLEGLRKYCHKHNMTISDVFSQWIEKDGLKPVLEAVSKFTVREKQIDQKRFLFLD